MARADTADIGVSVFVLGSPPDDARLAVVDHSRLTAQVPVVQGFGMTEDTEDRDLSTIGGTS